MCVQNTSIKSLYNICNPLRAAVHASGWHRLDKLLPFRTKTVVVVLFGGRDEQILGVMADVVDKLLEIGFGGNRMHHEAVLRSVSRQRVQVTFE